MLKQRDDARLVAHRFCAGLLKKNPQFCRHRLEDWGFPRYFVHGAALVIGQPGPTLHSEALCVISQLYAVPAGSALFCRRHPRSRRYHRK